MFSIKNDVDLLRKCGFLKGDVNRLHEKIKNYFAWTKRRLYRLCFKRRGKYLRKNFKLINGTVF